MKHIAIALVFAALLAGCADKPAKDAVIEDRGVRTTAIPDGAQAADTRGTAIAPMESKSIEAGAGAAGSGAAGAERIPAEKVETHGLAGAATEVKPLNGSTAGAAGAGTGTGAAQAGADAAAIALNLKDPLSPLSKRVVLFDYDSAAIRDEYRSLLEAHAEFMKSNPASKVILQGHADERGSREYNLALGQRRSESVFKAMSLLGVPELQMEAVSLGEEKPVAEGHNEEAWQQNRRTELIYQGE